MHETRKERRPRKRLVMKTRENFDFGQESQDIELTNKGTTVLEQRTRKQRHIRVRG